MTAIIDRTARRDLCALLARLFGAEPDDALLEAVRPLPGFGSATREELAVEFCRLFVGPPAACPPYASANGSEVLLGGRSRERLEAFLRRHDLSFDTEAARLASLDHASVELAALAALLDRGDEPAATELVEKHVRPWLPAWLARVEAEAREPFYRAAARLAGALFQTEPEENR